jgi:hypothetical protein
VKYSEALEKLAPKDAIAISSGEEKWQHQAEIFEDARQFHASGGKLIRLEFTHTEMQRYGNVAVLYGKYLYEIESNGKRSVSSGRATEVFVLTNGRRTNPAGILILKSKIADEADLVPVRCPQYRSLCRGS